MDDAELLHIEPSELTFHIELKKQSSCSLNLANKTDHYVAFKVKTSAPKKYCVIPNMGIIAPQGTCDVTVIVQAQWTAPLDFKCKDKFLIQSTVVSPYDIFSKNGGAAAGKYVVEEKKLNVVLLPLMPNVDLKQKEEAEVEVPSNSDPIHVQNEKQLPNGTFQNLSQALTPPVMIWMRIIEPIKILFMKHPNDAAQLSLAKNVEELKKDVEELKSKLSVMDLKLTAHPDIWKLQKPEASNCGSSNHFVNTYRG